MTKLILASTSVYRRELLSRLRLPFDVAKPNVEEFRLAAESARDMAVRLAQAKAQAVAKQHPQAVVIGSDQTLALGDEVLGKPGNFERALQQLQKLQGQVAVFHTAFCVMGPQREPFFEVCDTQIQFARLSTAQLERYLLLEQPFDCAGAAKAEALGISLTEAIRSDDPTAIIGLPLIGVVRALRAFGLDPLQVENQTNH